MTIGPLTFDNKLSSDSNGLFSIQSKVTQGQSSLGVQGVLGVLAEGFQPDLALTFESSDPSLLAEIAGLTDFPAAPLAIDGRFGMKKQVITLDKFNINLAGDQANIHGLVNLQDRYAGSDLTLDVDIRNIGELGRMFGQDGFPDQPVKLSAEVKPENSGLAFQVNDGNLGEIQIEFDGKIKDLKQLHWVDANFDINLPRLSILSFLLPNTQLPDAPFIATGEIESKDEQIQLRKVRINLAGNQASIDGQIFPENRYAGSQLNFELDIKNAGELGRMFGKDGLPDEPMKLSASIQPAGKGLDFKMRDGNLRDLQVELDGHIADLENPMGVEANFDINIPRLSEVSFLFPDREIPDVSFTASGQLHNETTQTSLDNVRLTLGEMTASVDGHLQREGRFDLTVKGAGPDAAVLGDLIGTSLPASPFTVSAGLKGRPSDFELQELDVSLGESQVEGTLAIRLGNEKHFKGKLESPNLDLSHWYSVEQAENESEPEPKRQWMFDDTPVMHLSQHHLDIDLSLKIDKLNLGNATIKEIDVGFLLSDKFLGFRPFTLKGMQEGHYSGEFSLDGSGSIPKLHLIMSGDNLRLGLAAAPGQDPSDYPPIDLDVTLDGSGTTRRELASSLTGKARVYQGSGQIANAGLSLFFSDFITQLFTTLNPFAKSDPYTQLDCAVIAADAHDGLVNVFPVIYQTEQLTILSQGKVDLNTEKVDLSFNTKPRTGLGLSGGALINQLIKVGGTLTKPAVEIDPAGTITSGGLAVATLGISVLAKSMTDRFLSSKDPCGDGRKEIEKLDSATN